MKKSLYISWANFRNGLEIPSVSRNNTAKQLIANTILRNLYMMRTYPTSNTYQSVRYRRIYILTGGKPQHRLLMTVLNISVMYFLQRDLVFHLFVFYPHLALNCFLSPITPIDIQRFLTMSSEFIETVSYFNSFRCGSIEYPQPTPIFSTLL